MASLHDRWLARVDDFIKNILRAARAPCQYERTVIRPCIAHVKGILSLIDLTTLPSPSGRETSLAGARLSERGFRADGPHHSERIQ